MEKYFMVQIEEILSKKVFVKAKDEDEAYDKVQELYCDEHIVLTMDDFTESEIIVNHEYSEEEVHSLDLQVFE